MNNVLSAKLDALLWRIPNRIPDHGETRRIDVSDCGIRIRDTGSTNPALVFFCDPPITVEAYDDLISLFRSQFRVIIVELPGFGFSQTRHVNGLSFEGAVESIELALTTLHLEQCVLVGPCICGFVASALARRGRLPVKGLVLLQTPDTEGMQAWVNNMDSRRILRLPLIGQLIVRTNFHKFTRTWLKIATAKSFDACDLIDKMQEAFHKGAGYPLATMFQLWPERLWDAHLVLPALVIWGKQDRTHSNTDTCSTRKHVHNGHIIEFNDCGHSTELENPTAFASAVVPFLHSCFSQEAPVPR